MTSVWARIQMIKKVSCGGLKLSLKGISIAKTSLNIYSHIIATSKENQNQSTKCVLCNRKRQHCTHQDWCYKNLRSDSIAVTLVKALKTWVCCAFCHVWFQVELRGSPAVHLDMIVLFCFFFISFSGRTSRQPSRRSWSTTGWRCSRTRRSRGTSWRTSRVDTTSSSQIMYDQNNCISSRM